MDSDYRFGNFLQLSAFGSKDKASLTDSFRSVGALGGRSLGFPSPDPMQDWLMRLSLDFQRLAENESISAIDHLASNEEFSMLPVLRSKSTSRDQLFTVV